MKPYLRYRFKRQVENILVFIAWCLSFLWLIPYAVSVILLVIMVPIMAVVILTTAAGTQDRIIYGIILLAGLIIVAASNIPTVHVLARLRKHHRAAKDLTGLEDLPERLDFLIRGRLAYLATRMETREKNRLASCRFQLLIERKNHKAPPCMIVRKQVVNLIFPLGFFKVLQGDQEAADAMLAHELAHFLHGDSGMLLGVRSYLRASTVMFYYVGAIFLLIAAFSVVQWGALTTEEQAIGSRASDRAQYVTQYYERNSVYAWPYDADSRRRARIESEKTAIVLRLATYFLSFFYYWFLLLYLRRRVRRSEMLADLFAAITTNADAVKRFLSRYVADEERHFLSLHPSVNRRIDFMTKCRTS